MNESPIPQLADNDEPVVFKEQKRFRLSKSHKKYMFAAFVVIFAGIGTYFLIHSFADTVSLTKTWSTTADWNSGSLSNVIVANNDVSLAPLQTNLPTVAPNSYTVPPSIADNTNLALQKPAFASSRENSSLGASNAFDGNLDTRWSSNFSDPQWIAVDLESTYNIKRVDLHWETAYGKAYRVQVSKNGWQWTTIYSTNNGTGGDNNLTNLTGVGRYVRMIGTKRGTKWGYSLWEMAVYGTPVNKTSPTTPTPTKPAATEYQSSGSLDLTFDASTSVTWTTLTPAATLPSSTNITYKVRTSSDGSNWSSWMNSISQAGSSRYIQIEADLSTSNSLVTPTLTRLSLGYNLTVAAPTATITAKPITLTAGGTATLNWSSTNATSCSASGGWTGDQATSGSVVTTAINQTTTYTISCTGSGGTTSASTTVTAQPAPISTPVSTTGGGTTTTATSKLGASPVLFPDSMFDSGQAQSWPLDANSSEYAQDFVADYTDYYGSVGVNTQPMYTVAANTPAVTMTVASGCNNFLSNTGSTVPIPSYAALNGSGDNPISIYQPSTDSLWEFWQAQETSTPGVWQACWGGKLNPSTSSGVFAYPFGRSATGISEYATAITDGDIESGTIKHAIAVAIPRCNGSVYPANRGDCGSDAGQIPEGQYFRLSSNTNCTGLVSTFADMVCVAIRNYGMVVTDQAGAVMLESESQTDWAQEGNSGTDPLAASWQGEPEYTVVWNIPWTNLQAVDPPNPYNP